MEDILEQAAHVAESRLLFVRFHRQREPLGRVDHGQRLVERSVGVGVNGQAAQRAVVALAGEGEKHFFQAAVGTAVAEATDGVVAGLTSINGSKKLATTMLDANGSAMLKYFALEDAPADEYCMAFPKDSELTALFNEGIQTLQDSGKLDEMIQYWLY